MSLRRRLGFSSTPRVQEQRLSYGDVVSGIGAIMNDRESAFDNMSLDEFSARATATLLIYRNELYDIYFRAPEADESYRQEIQEVIDLVEENRNTIRRFSNIVRQRGRGFTVGDLREEYQEQERQREQEERQREEQERRRVALQQGVYVRNPDGTTQFAEPSNPYREGEGGL